MKTQRTNALPAAFFDDVNDGQNAVSLLRSTGSKSAKQKRLDARKAHAIARRQRQVKSERLQRLGVSSDYLIDNGLRLDNRIFRPGPETLTAAMLNCDQPLTRNISRNIDGSFTSLREYTQDRAILDKSNHTRRRN